MCSGIICGVSTVAIGAALVVASTVVGFYYIPSVIESTIINEVVLLNGTEQLERFQEIPFPLNFKVRLFNITNAGDVLAGGVPVLNEIGPYCYKLYQQRVIEHAEEDRLSYRRLDRFEFDPVASFPYSEDDLVHITNVAYHGILQVASESFGSLMPALNLALDGVFGDSNGPIAEVRVGDLLFDGIKMCESPGVVGAIACTFIRQLSGNVQNMEIEEDNTITFSILGYRNGKPGSLHEVFRGVEDHADVGRITAFNNLPELPYWAGAVTADPKICNMINGTDSGIFHPFVDKSASLYALSTDICRSVELRYQYDLEYAGIPVTRFAAHEWFLDNDEGCFCLNLTAGISREDGCLLKGAMELYSCVGAYMVLSYPHFLFADMRYRNGVIGMHPVVEDHRLFMDLEPNTGTVVRGSKRAQFNVFMRPIAGIPETQSLRPTLTPLLWIDEGIELTEEYTDKLSTNLLSTLSLVNVLVPVVVALTCAILLTGITIVICARLKKPMNI